MEITKVYSDKENVTVKFTGHFTLENVSIFTQKINPLLNEKKSCFFFNFKEITMLDSSGIGALLKCANSMKNLGITLHIYNVNNHIEAIMESAYLHKIFMISDVKNLKKEFPDIKF